LSTDSSASVQTGGLFGTKYINIKSDDTITITKNSLVVADLLEQTIAKAAKWPRKENRREEE
jgi:ABC-type transporter Mla subunit MlaD